MMRDARRWIRTTSVIALLAWGLAPTELVSDARAESRADLIDAIAKRAGITRSATQKIVDELFGLMAEDLSKGETIDLSGFGTFGVRESGGRKNVFFKPAKKLEDSLNKK